MTNDYIPEAVQLVAAQARQRPMTEKDMIAAVKIVSHGLQRMYIDKGASFHPTAHLKIDPLGAIQENNIVCCVCGEAKKALTAPHLAKHGLTVAEYRALCGYDSMQPLVARAISKKRREKMSEMKLWEKRVTHKADQF